MKFEITYIFEKQRPVTLFARQLGAGEFTLSESPMLGGVPIKRYVSQPRAITPDCVFRPNVTAHFGIVTGHFGHRDRHHISAHRDRSFRRS
jgi:hypothetical protein